MAGTTVAAFVAALAWTSAVQAQALGTGTLYFGGYSGHIVVLDEASEQVSTKIPLSTGFPNSVLLSQDGTRLYSLSANRQKIEIVDVVSRKSIDNFTLNEAATRLLVQGFAPDPAHKFLYVAGRATTKYRDYFGITTPTLYKYDLASHRIVQAVEWGQDYEPRFMTTMRLSPDGSLLYVFSDRVLVYQTSDLKRVAEHDMSRPIETGFGSVVLGSFDDVLDEPGFLTGIFTTEDPLQHRKQLGVGRFDLALQTVDFFTLGPLPDARSLDFALAPDRKKAYMLVQQIGHYEFWTIDLVARRVGSRVEFQGRPRMSVRTSTNGKVIYIFGAGPTIDLYDPNGFKYLRTITIDTDMPYDTFHAIPPHTTPGRQ